MTVEEYSQRVGALLRIAKSEHPVINARLSLSALNLIRARIINEGKDHKGVSFGKYSQNKLPIFFYQKKPLPGAKEKPSLVEKKLQAYKKKQSKLPKKDQGLSYEEWRKMNGLQTKHIDMSFTKETLNDLAVLESRTQGNVVITLVASKDSIQKDKKTSTGKVTEYLGERYGNFLQVSDQEIKILQKAFDEEVQKLIDKIIQ